MKRSEINDILREGIAFAAGKGFILPPFAFWGPGDWASKDERYDEMRQAMLGWDITDFGSGDYDKTGLLMFTVRNGCLADERFPKPYAEKMLISKKDQVTPFHFHYQKMEDIINRGGGELKVQLYNSTPDEAFADTPVEVIMDGFHTLRPAGSVVTVKPGQSITLSCGVYHSFWAEGEMTLLGEVSKVNDDRVDNRFYKPVGRFPAIEEDEPPLHLLSLDYPGVIQRA